MKNTKKNYITLINRTYPIIHVQQMRNDGINLNEKDINLLMSLQYLPDDSPFANMQIRVKNRNGYKEIWTLDTVETAIFECLIGIIKT